MRRALIVAASLTFAAFACQVVAGIERVDKVEVPPLPPPDAAPDTFVPDPCEHLDVPSIPPKDDDPDASLGVQYLAIHDLTFLPRTNDGGFIGADLDHVCTCDSRAGSPDGGACVSYPGQEVCDEFGGVDNQLARILDPYAKSVFDIDKAADVNQHILEGRQGLLIYLTNYNGEPNDREVQLGVYLSNGIVDPAGCGSDEVQPLDVSTGPRYVPKWCGKDRWSFDPRTTLVPANVPNVVTTGWVTDGVLVTRADTATIYLGTLPLRLSNMRISGRLSKVGDIWHIDDGMIAGRVAVGDLLQGAGVLAFGSLDAGRYLCREGLWGVIRSNICQGADVTASAAFDFQGRPCDAISVAIGYHAQSADLGGKVDPTDLPNPCLGDAAPPGSYVCR